MAPDRVFKKIEALHRAVDAHRDTLFGIWVCPCSSCRMSLSNQEEEAKAEKKFLAEVERIIKA